MVLERIISIREAIEKPWWMFLIGGIVSVICLLVSFLVFPNSVGLFTTFLITFAMTPFMVSLINYEEARTEQLLKKHEDLNFLDHHKQILKIYSAFFTGMILFLSIVFIIMPQPIVEKLFENQINEIKLIRGNAVVADTFSRILVNNVGVLLITIVFSLLFGAGAVFILAWNASVLAAAIGLTAQSLGGVGGLPLAVLVFFPHGSLEILAYFIGGVAGGLISVVLTKRKMGLFGRVFRDSLLLIGGAVVFLLIAAFVEVSSIALAG